MRTVIIHRALLLAVAMSASPLYADGGLENNPGPTVPILEIVPCRDEAIAWLKQSYQPPNGYKLDSVRDLTNYWGSFDFNGDSTITLQYKLTDTTGRLVCSGGIASIHGRVFYTQERGSRSPNLCMTDNQFRFSTETEIDDSRLISESSGNFENPNNPSSCQERL